MGYTVTFGYLISLFADICSDNSLVASVKVVLNLLAIRVKMK